MINLKNISAVYNLFTDYSFLKELAVNGYQIPCFVSTGVTALIIWHDKLDEFENYCRKFEVCFILPDNAAIKIESNNLQRLTTTL